MPRPVRSLGLAVTLLTAVPLPVRLEPGERSDAASYFPLVGLLVGLPLAAVLWIATRFFYGLSGYAAGVVLLAIAFLTRGLHWDGLADTADAWFVDERRRLEVMADSRVGSFGAVAIVLVALLQWSALVEMSTSQTTAATVILAPVFGRMAATFSAWFGTPARPGGLGSSVMGRPSLPGIFAVIVTLALACWVPYYLGLDPVVLAVIAGVGVIASLGVPHLVALRFGGVTGDTMGASVLLVETILLAASLAVVAVARLIGLSA